MVKGIVRRIDELGRIVIPMEYRKELNIGIGTKIDMYLSKGTICLEVFKEEICCINCKSVASPDNALVQFKDNHICEHCLSGFVKNSENK